MPTAVICTDEFVASARAQAAISGFIQEFAPQGTRIYEWQKDTNVNFGVLQEVDGIVESHYISIEVG